MRTAEQIAKAFIPCTCGEAYRSRNMIAPDCPLCSFGVEDAINEARKESIEECKNIMYEFDIDDAVKQVNKLIADLK